MSAEPKEVDLRSVLGVFREVFKSIGNGLLSIVLSIRRAFVRNRVLFLICMTLAVIAGIWMSSFGPQYYESKMVLRSEFLNPQTVAINIEKLDDLCKERNFAELADQLGISEESAAQLKGFDYLEFVSEEDKVEVEILREKLKNELKQVVNADRIIEIVDLENRHSFQVIVESYDQQLPKTLTEPVSSYFRNIPYVKNRLDINERNLAYKADNLRKEAQQLDTLQTMLDENMVRMSQNTKEGAISLSLGENQQTDQLSVLKEKLRILDYELAIRRELFLKPKFEVIDPFTAYQKSSNPSLIKSIPSSLLVGFLVALLLSMLWEANRFLARAEEERS